MAGRRARPPRGKERTPAIEVKDEQTDRALTQIRLHLDKLDAARKRDVIEFDLVVGTNKIPHGLGRPVAGYTITPTVTDPFVTFSHAIDRENPRPDLTVWITVIGVAQPKALIEVY
jgi:hypothetical protein